MTRFAIENCARIRAHRSIWQARLPSQRVELHIIESRRGHFRTFSASDVRNDVSARRRPAARGARAKMLHLGGDVRVGPLLPIPVLLAEHGLDPATVLAEVGFTRRLFDNPENRVSLRVVGSLLATCVKATGCPHFGLLVGERFEIEYLGLLGRLVRNCATVRDALRMASVHLDVHDRGAVALMIDLDESRVAFGYSIFDGDTPAAEQILDGAVAMEFRLLRELCGRSWKPLWVQLSHRQPATIGPYRECFGARPVFDARFSAVVFDSRWLDHRIAGADPASFSALVDAIRSRRLRRGVTFGEQVRRAIYSMTFSGSATSANLAALFGLHERTLRRRLEEEGATVRGLIGEVRRELANHLLRNTKLAVTDIASILGYSDVAVFSRAFRGRAGKSPREWRTRTIF